MRIYDYRILRVAPNCWPTAIESIKSKGMEAVEDAGGHFYGLWIVQIGLSVNQGVVITDWENSASAEQGGPLAVQDSDVLVESIGGPIYPTTRPQDNSTPDSSGVFSHRWFDVREPDWPRFLELSERCWGQIETVFGSRVVGFWHSGTVDKSGILRARLLGQYRDLKSWQDSRYWSERPNMAARDALEYLRKRREITLDTGVSIMRMV